MKKFMACNKYPLAQSIQTLACILISFSSTNHQTLERIFHLNFINDFLNQIKKNISTSVCGCKGRGLGVVKKGRSEVESL